MGVATALATPLIRSYNVKTMMNGDGDWSMTWDALTDIVRTEINAQLYELGLDGGLDEDNNFKFGVSGTSKSEPLTETVGTINLGATVGDQEPLVVSDTFTGNSVEELDAWMAESQAKFLAKIKQHSESFYQMVKEQLEAMKTQN